MGDINLLSQDDHAADESGARAKAVQDEDLTLHVPSPETAEPPPPSGVRALSHLIDKSAKPEPLAEKLLSQKIEPIPSMPSRPVQKPAAPPALRVPVPAPPAKPATPNPAPVLKKGTMNAEKPLADAGENKDAGTLRVSLITGNGASGLSDLALRRRLRLFALAGILAVAADGLIFGGLRFWKRAVEQRNLEAEKAVHEIDAAVATRETAVSGVRDFQALSTAAARVLDAHAHWTEVLKLLEERALPEVQFGSLAGAETGTLGFEVTARDYTTLAKQIVAFRQDARVKQVTVGTASADIGENQLLKGVRASVTLVIDPAVFRYQAQTAANPAQAALP